MSTITGSFQPPPLISNSKSNGRWQRQRQQQSPSLLPSIYILRQMMYASPLIRQRFASPPKVTAIPSPAFLAVTSPAKSGDISVLLQTGGVLLTAYLIANFVVPAFIMKSYEAEENEEKKKQKRESEAPAPAPAEEEESETNQGDGEAILKAKREGFSSKRR